MIIKKKDGSKVDFDSYKIYRAVKQAATRANNELTEDEREKLARNIELLVINELNAAEEEEVSTTDIQTFVESFLMSLDKNVAVTYIEFRNKQDLQRKGVTSINKSLQKVIMRDKKVINENANKDGDKFPVMRDLTAGSVAKAIGLKQMLPKRVANAHIKGDIHFHDLDYHPYTPMTNCCLINFKDMFENGFKIGNATISSPKSIQTAVAQTAQIIANVSSNQYGGCSFDRIDETLAPYAHLNFLTNLRDSIRASAELKGIILSNEELEELVLEASKMEE